MFAYRTDIRYAHNRYKGVGPVMSRGDRSREHVQSLERGLEVLTAFSDQHPRLTLTEAAELTDLPRATARRLLLTLAGLGYVRNHGRYFELTPKVLDIGYAYLSSLDLPAVAQPEMERLVERVHESSSVAVLEGTEIVYVVRVPTERIMTISLALGSRLPAWATSMGRVLLAALEDDELAQVLDASDIRALTFRTITDRDELRRELAKIARQGYAIVDQELEDGLRSIAAPIRNACDHVVAAMNLSTNAGRVTLERLRAELIPALVETADRISDGLARAPAAASR